MKSSNELARYVKLYQNVTMFYWQELVSLFQVKKRMRVRGNLNYKVFV